MERRNRSRGHHSNGSEAIRIFKSQIEEDKQQIDSYSGIECNKSDLSADDEDNYFFLNFIKSAESSHDDHSAVQSNYQPKMQSSRILSEV
jgi:hypothetical protein